MDELVDSGGLAGNGDEDGLRRRLASDGYLFFRGLLPPGDVREAGSFATARLRDGGWTDARGTPSPEPRTANSMKALADPAFRAAVTGAAFNQVAYLPPLRRLVRRVLGPGAFSYPAKVLRAVYPEGPATRPRGRYVHYDYGVSGVQDMLTSWIPLMDVPVRLGGLAVRPGGHLKPPRPPRVLGSFEPGWATTDYRPGDVIVFHCMTPHAALPNHGRTLRLSTDLRWQRPDRPAPAELILGPALRPGRPVEMFSRLFRREPWWEPVPPDLELRPRAQLAAVPPGPSDYFAVHPGWRRWKPPPAALH